MTKDRLAALRAAQNDGDEEEIHQNYDSSVFMEEFFNQVDDIRTNVENIQRCVNEVKQLHSKILAAPTTDDKVKDDLEKRMAEIKRTAQIVRGKLKDMSTLIENSGDSDGSGAVARIKKSQYCFLSYLLNDIMGTFNAVQIEHRENLVKRIARQLEITGQKTDEAEIERMIESGNPQIFTEGILTETRIAKQTLADIEARHKDILKLEESIKELHDMFMDMAMLVEAQGEMIDRIEFNVQKSVDFITAAKQDTKKAVKYQAAARRKKIIIIIIIIIVIIIVVVILVVVLSAYLPKPAPSQPTTQTNTG